MCLKRLSSGWIALAAVVLVSASPAPAADWFRNFNNGNTNDGGGVPLINQPLPGVPAGEWQTSVVDVPSVADKSFRMKFAGLPNSSNGDSGVMLDHNDIFIGKVSAKMLIRFSTNPFLAETPTNSTINAGFIVHVQGDFQSYICVIDDRGYLQLQEVQPGLNIAGFPGGSKDTPDFDVTKDWWIRFEVLPVPEGMHLRARAWRDGTPEPQCLWIVEAIDDQSPLPGGATAIVANEDANVPDGLNFVDVDNVSMSSQLTCVEVCGNSLDDDEDGKTDCDDIDCDLHATCACHSPFADVDGDGDVDQLDFAEFQLCYTGAGDAAGVFNAAKCDCLDREEINNDGKFGRLTDGDGDIDAADLEAFLKCFSAPHVLAAAGCEGPR